MTNIANLLTEHMGIWTAADTEKKSGRGRASGNAGSVYGVKKLRELILELAVRGKLVPQDPNDEPASELLKRIQAEKTKLIAEGKLKKEKQLAPIGEDEKNFELPNGWQWVRFQDVSTYIQRGKGPEYADASPYIVVSQKCVRWSGIDLDVARYISPESLSKYEEIRFLKNNDLLWNSTGTGTIGRACLYQNSDLQQKSVADSHVTIVRTLFGIDQFLFRYIQSPIVQNEIEAMASGTTNQIELNTSTVIAHLLPLPPLAEQHRIVAKVDELMALCDQLEQQHSNAQEAHETLVSQLLGTLTQSQNAAEFNANWQRIYAHFDVLFTTEASIDALKQTLLQLAVMGKLVPQDPKDEPASDLIKNILITRNNLIQNEGLKTVASEAFEPEDFYIQVPASWSYCRLGNLAKFIDYRGKTPNKVESGVRLITAKNVRQGYINLEPEEFVTSHDYDLWMTRGFPRIGDMLFTTEAPLGNIALIEITEKFALAQRVICFQLHNQDMGSYLKIALMSKQVQQQFESESTGMTATGIKASNLKEIPIPIPPLAEQQRIVAKVDALMALCDQLKTRIQQANQQQQAIADALVAQAVA